MSTSSVKISSDGMYGIYKGIPRLWDLTEIQCGIRATLTAYGLPPYTHVWGEGLLLILLFLVNCTLSSLAKSPNQCCKLSLKSPE